MAESNTAIDLVIVSSEIQLSKNSSKVTTPSLFRSILCKKKKEKRRQLMKNVLIIDIINCTIICCSYGNLS